ncbi:hypothetical protein RCO48_31405 [Peribacillus frigoritolerans]|nr:hypothetical protein [Peribacillus frigoritolerans]
MLNKAAEMADIPDVGTHTLRKTFGYLHYQKIQGYRFTATNP